MTMKRTNSGFTLIELMMAVMIVGILAALTTMFYTDYMTRIRVVEGIEMASPIHKNVAEYYYTNAVFPTSNSEVGIPAALSTQYVSDISVTAGGLITITYNANSGLTAGETIQYVPVINAGGNVAWTCNGAGTTVSDRYLPATCR